ncbi:aminoglycoside phosphotransferase family protein [Streptomyces sp. 8K308]|uniref:phosphotransferase family protein n=1 Tax=Streptomyces sp. 8K308 TaxID=2530388 RepID=UPI00104A6B8D|nr:aminoglycoside phosphotransferase family protein [Streptomyces sp. 8K308]TDC27291.1 aminoglycoside phosphotransferase family protein [Streptomyces sp. 8K308]
MSQSLPRPTLRGNHRVWQVVEAEGELAALGRLKTGRTRPGVHRFDPRCFVNEEDVLIELALLGMRRIAPVYRLVGADDELRVHGYIEGQPLSAIRPPGTALTGSELGQLVDLFGKLATIRPSAFALVHRCPPVLRPRGSRQFLQTLIRFTRRRVYAVHRPLMRDLFTALRIGPTVLSATGPLAREAAKLTDRPFCLLHGDLHRDNLIVAESDGMLWTIDWELALIGDPLYDLATHLHLMRYPPKQEHALLLRWARTMDAALPGSAAALARDLPRYLAYKRVQSVFTDVIRQAYVVQATPPAQLAEQLPRTVEMVHGVMRRAARMLGLGRVPSPRAIEAAYATWYVNAPPPPSVATADQARTAATRPGGP